MNTIAEQIMFGSNFFSMSPDSGFLSFSVPKTFSWSGQDQPLGGGSCCNHVFPLSSCLGSEKLTGRYSLLLLFPPTQVNSSTLQVAIEGCCAIREPIDTKIGMVSHSCFRLNEKEEIGRERAGELTPLSVHRKTGETGVWKGEMVKGEYLSHLGHLGFVHLLQASGRWQ